MGATSAIGQDFLHVLRLRSQLCPPLAIWRQGLIYTLGQLLLTLDTTATGLAAFGSDGLHQLWMVKVMESPHIAYLGVTGVAAVLAGGVSKGSHYPFPRLLR